MNAEINFGKLEILVQMYGRRITPDVPLIPDPLRRNVPEAFSTLDALEAWIVNCNLFDHREPAFIVKDLQKRAARVSETLRAFSNDVKKQCGTDSQVAVFGMRNLHKHIELPAKRVSLLSIIPIVPNLSSIEEKVETVIESQSILRRVVTDVNLIPIIHPFDVVQGQAFQKKVMCNNKGELESVIACGNADYHPGLVFLGGIE